LTVISLTTTTGFVVIGFFFSALCSSSFSSDEEVDIVPSSPRPRKSISSAFNSSSPPRLFALRPRSPFVFPVKVRPKKILLLDDDDGKERRQEQHDDDKKRTCVGGDRGGGEGAFKVAAIKGIYLIDRERKRKRESEVTFAPKTSFEHTQFQFIYLRTIWIN
jgi:hypothetical protein